MSRSTLFTALQFAAVSYPVYAQSPTIHESLYSGQDQMPTPMQTACPCDQSREHRGKMGMMGHGMMGHPDMTDHAAGSPIMTRMIIALIDSDGDGANSLSEFQIAHERLFKAKDSN